MDSQTIAAIMVTEVSVTAAFGFCMVGGSPPQDEGLLDADGNACLDSERQSLIEGTVAATSRCRLSRACLRAGGVGTYE